MTTEQIQNLAGPLATQLVSAGKLKTKILELLEERRKSLMSSCLQVSSDQNALNLATQSALARAVVGFGALPDKLNPVIKPLMDSVKMEENEQMQEASARTLARLLDLCQSRSPCPNNKILKNVCLFLCADAELTPRASVTDLDGILTLMQQQRTAEKALSSSKRANCVDSEAAASARALELQRRGAIQVLEAVASHFGAELPLKASFLWDMMMNIKSADQPATIDDEGLAKAEDLIQSLQVLEVMASSIHSSLHGQLLDLLPTLCFLLENPFRAVRHMGSRCLAALGAIDADRVLTMVVEKVIPMLGAIDRERMRQGAIESLSCLVDRMGMSIVPFIVLLVIPVLGRMSDVNEPVRLVATQSFATLIRLMPLEGGVPDPPALSPELAEKKVQQRHFLEQLFDPKKLENYKVILSLMELH